MERQADAVVIGAGVVAVCVAAHLQLRGGQTVLVDNARPGHGTSYGNAGLIQDEAIMPYLFPRSIDELLRYARNKSIDASYEPTALPSLANPFFRYWRNSDRGPPYARCGSWLLPGPNAPGRQTHDWRGVRPARLAAAPSPDHGLTLGPTTGRLLAEIITGEKPFVDPRPYGIERFG